LSKFLAAARKRSRNWNDQHDVLAGAVPQQFVQVDQEKVLKQGVAIDDVYQTIQAFMGGLFINYFNDFGRTWQVYVEAEAPYPLDLAKLGQFYVRNNRGDMVPLTALTKFESYDGPRVYDALQRVQVSADQWQRRAWI